MAGESQEVSHEIFTARSHQGERTLLVPYDGLVRGGVSVALLVEKRYLAQRQPVGLAVELRRRGCTVEMIDPGATALSLTDPGWLEGFDVCVARGRSPAVLSALLVAERHGIPTINRQSAIAAVHDKAAMAVALAGRGLPTPPTSLGSPARLAAELALDLYPVIVKPILGDNCRGLRLCQTPDELVRLGGEEPLLAQPYLAGDGMDLKLYGVGARVWAVRKPSPFRPGDPPRNGAAPQAGPVELTAELRELALGCSDLFRLELFGVDCLLTPEGPVVIEVNEYPNYSGVAEADEALATHVLARAPRRASRAASPVLEAVQ
jgi:ribosomal protein S6--L-glutamate ligase